MNNPKNTITSIREFTYQRELVYNAFVNPEYLAQWWGPNGFTNTIHKFDLKPGGDWTLTMHSPDGQDFYNVSKFEQVVAPELIVYKHLDPVHVFTGSLAFGYSSGKTRVVFTMTFESDEEYNKVKDFIIPANEQNFDRLEKVLSTMPANRELIFSRLLNAPRELVFAVWTKPEHIINWWGPNGFTNTIEYMDASTGGSWKYMMHGPDGRDYPNFIKYTEVVKPEKIRYLHGEDEGEKEQFEGLITLQQEGNNQTRLTMRLLFNNAEELEYVVREFGAADGGNQTLNKLTNYINQLVS
ncbi:SRPBCC family protein [Mucilaginibacter sp. UR6-1]|uniref:SRPBCC family protein n=1 Tax=Mucilaginibacter sp. UR6-1 TaxID=1435643 RepID=UPI001E5BB27D|nr:SRPBCC family protein [Mucilaginibacter sp. UR6-1]MCC8411227.1 SRPBCC family protein [Mucilaginibacter sp. UR6-1]